MTTTWYRANNYSIKLEPVEVESDTKYMVTIVSKSAGKINTWREHKLKENSGVFKTKREAYAWKIDRATKCLAIAKSALESCRDQLNSFIEAAKADGVEL